MKTELFSHHTSDWSKTLIVGLGNRIKSDDGVGIEIAFKLLEKGIKNVIIAENSIENYLGKINAFPADEILMIGAVDQNKEPGFFQCIPLEEIENTTTNTHNLSLDTIASFLSVKNIWILAIQPARVSFGFGLTDKVREASEIIIQQFLSAVIESQIPLYQ